MLNEICFQGQIYQLYNTDYRGRLVMNHEKLIAHLKANADVFKYQFLSVSEDQAGWKPAKDRWSILEVVNHLGDEEREDFRQRLELVLNDPEAPWPAIDPEGWVIQRKYNDRNFRQSLDGFFEQRDISIRWLNELVAPDWRSAHQHPQLGSMSAELILANWVAHDLFHIRQIADLHFEYIAEVVHPVSLDYSGWG